MRCVVYRVREVRTFVSFCREETGKSSFTCDRSGTYLGEGVGAVPRLLASFPCSMWLDLLLTCAVGLVESLGQVRGV